MLELLPKSLVDVVTRPKIFHSRDWSTDSSSDGLLSPTGSPVRARWRKSSASLFRNRRSAYWACVLLVVVALGLWTWSRQDDEIPVHDGEEVPIGQSRYRDGREVFWWEQFPRYAKRSMRSFFTDHSPGYTAFIAVARLSCPSPNTFPNKHVPINLTSRRLPPSRLRARTSRKMSRLATSTRRRQWRCRPGLHTTVFPKECLRPCLGHTKSSGST